MLCERAKWHLFSRGLEEYKKTTSFRHARYAIECQVRGKTRVDTSIRGLSEYASLARVKQKGFVILPFADLGDTHSIESGVLRRENLNPMDSACES